MAKRLLDGNESTAKMVTLCEKKLIMKNKYSRAKLKILQNKNIILERIAVSLENKYK